MTQCFLQLATLYGTMKLLTWGGIAVRSDSQEAWNTFTLTIKGNHMSQAAQTKILPVC